jgi:hypothetical protein
VPATVSALVAVVLICMTAVLIPQEPDEAFETYLTYYFGRGYAVEVSRRRTVLRTSKPLVVPPLQPWVPAAASDVDIWKRARRQTWRQWEFAGFWFFAGEIVLAGAGQHPFLPDASVTRIRSYDMDHAVAVPHWASVPASLVLPVAWLRRRRRLARLPAFDGVALPDEVNEAASPSAPGPR